MLFTKIHKSHSYKHFRTSIIFFLKERSKTKKHSVLFIIIYFHEYIVAQEKYSCKSNIRFTIRIVIFLCCNMFSVDAVKD